MGLFFNKQNVLVSDSYSVWSNSSYLVMFTAKIIHIVMAHTAKINFKHNYNLLKSYSIIVVILT